MKTKMSDQQPPEKRYDLNDTTLRFVNRPDDLDPLPAEDGDEGLRAEMSCGHAVTPESLTGWCRSLLDQGQYKFKCPAVGDGLEQCGAEWSYTEVRRLAVLTAEEMQHFEETLARLASVEFCDFKACPGCKTYVEREDDDNLCFSCTVCDRPTKDFCWQCLRPWKGPAPRTDRCDNPGCVNHELELLKTCRTIVLTQVQGVGPCPSVRACPTCGLKVEHDKTGCKSILCPRCQVEFCFVCLKPTEECLKTSSYFIACSRGIAPRQTSIPTWRRKYDPLDDTLILVDKPDEIDPHQEESCRALMSCGHAVTPGSLTGWCRHLLSQGQYKFTCPALKPGGSQCGAEWSYPETRRLALLTVQELGDFENELARLAAADMCDIKVHPGCGTTVERRTSDNLCFDCTICRESNKPIKQFCWQCLRLWKGPAPRTDCCDNPGCVNPGCVNHELELLKTCGTIVLPRLQGVGPCPSLRACPTCGMRVAHNMMGCKSIVCPRCIVKFCFVCLKPTEECLKTSSYYIACSGGIAPRQTSIPTWCQK